MKKDLQKGMAATIVILLVVIAALGVGIYVYSDGNKGASLYLKKSGDLVMEDTSSPDLMMGESMEMKEDTALMMKIKNAVGTADITQQDGVLVAALKDIQGGDLSGSAYILRTNDGIQHKVIADLPEPDGFAAYEGWLVKREPELSFFSTGTMEKNSNGLFELYYASNEQAEGYDFVVITAETVVDKTPEDHVLEGTAR